MINTTADKEVGVVFEYLSAKQCEVSVDRIVIKVGGKEVLTHIDKGKKWSEVLTGL
jgi:hypothetical protein